MGKKNKMKHKTSQSAGQELMFANSKISKKNNAKNKAFISEKKKSLIATQNSETIPPLRKVPTSPSSALNAQNNKKNKKSKNKHVISQHQDNLNKPISNETTGSKNKNKKKKTSKQNDSVSKEQSDKNIVVSPNSILKCATDKSGSDQQLSKSARRRLKKRLEKKTQVESSSEKTKGMENYISLTSPKSSAGERNGLSKPNNFTCDSPKKKSLANNQSVSTAENVAKTKSIYSASSSDDELNFDTSDEEEEEPEENKSGIEHLKKKENQQLIKSTGGIMKKSQSDIESDDDDDVEDTDSSSEEDLPKADTKHMLTKNVAKQDEEEDSKEKEVGSFKYFKTASLEIKKYPQEGNGVNNQIFNMEIDDGESLASLNSDDLNMVCSEDNGKKPNKKLSISSLVDKSSKRKIDSSQKLLQQEKGGARNNDSEYSSDEDDNEEEDGDVEAKDFIDLEADEGEDSNENSSEEEEAPPLKKSKHSFAADQDNEDENKVFINNLPPNTTEDSLGQALSEAGDASSIIIPKNRDNPGECRGFAFVTLPDKETLDKVLRLDKVADIDGQTINIRLYTNDKGGRGGGFRGSPGGRGFRGGRGGFRGFSEGRGRGFRGSPSGRGGGYRGGSPGGRGGAFRDKTNKGGAFGGSGDRNGGFRGRGGGGFRGSPGGRGRGFRGGRGGSSE